MVYRCKTIVPRNEGMRITDVHGRTVLSATGNGTAQQVVDASQLPGGLYTLVMSDAFGVRTARFVRCAR